MGTIIGREMHQRNRMAIFREQTATRYGTQLTMITTFGVLHNKHYSVVDTKVALEIYSEKQDFGNFKHNKPADVNSLTDLIKF